MKDVCTDECMDGDKICDKHVEKVRNEWKCLIPPRYKEAILNKHNRENVKKAVDYIDYGIDGLLLSGTVGTGKTHLMWSMANYLIENTEIKEQNQSSPFEMYDCKDLTFKFHWYYMGKEKIDLPTFIKSIPKRNKILLLDDFGHGETTKAEFSVNAWNMFVDELYNQCIKVVLVSNYSMSELVGRLGIYASDRIGQLVGTNIITFKGNSLR